MTQAEVSRSYQEAEIRGASSVECTIMLYDMLVGDLRKAIAAIADGDLEARTIALGHGLRVLGELQGTLQMESGGDAARHLYNLYSLARAKLLEGQIKGRARLLEEIVDAMLAVRALWVEVRESCPEARENSPETREPAASPAATPEPWEVAPDEPAGRRSVWHG